MNTTICQLGLRGEAGGQSSSYLRFSQAFWAVETCWRPTGGVLLNTGSLFHSSRDAVRLSWRDQSALLTLLHIGRGEVMQ